MANYVSITSNKNKHVAFILCLFGGLVGAHQFYVGNVFRGIFYMFTLGCFGKCYWWDLWHISLGTFQDNTGTYLRQ
jgi:TM2 domain-containing membrane protein YozV